MSASRSKKVKVWVRTRPTTKFAHENIDLKADGKVIVYTSIFCEWVVFILCESVTI